MISAPKKTTTTKYVYDDETENIIQKTVVEELEWPSEQAKENPVLMFSEAYEPEEQGEVTFKSDIDIAMEETRQLGLFAAAAAVTALIVTCFAHNHKD